MRCCRVTLIVVVLVLGVGQRALASECPSGVTPVTVLFLNGIWTTEADAIKSRNKIAALVTTDPRWSQVEAACVTFDYSWNRLDFFAGDLIDVLVQFFGSRIGDVLRVLAGAVPSNSISDGLVLLSQGVNIAACLATGADCYTLMGEVAERTKTHRLIAIPHSQGNLYWNTIYEALVNVLAVVPPGRLATIGAATPTLVPPGAAYSRILEDPVTLTSELVANATNAECILFACHSFRDSYLAAPSSRTAILDFVFARLPRTTSADPTTVTLNFTGTVDLSPFGGPTASTFNGSVTWDPSAAPFFANPNDARYRFTGATLLINGVDHSNRIQSSNSSVRIQSTTTTTFELSFGFFPNLDVGIGADIQFFSGALFSEQLWSSPAALPTDTAFLALVTGGTSLFHWTGPLAELIVARGTLTAPPGPQVEDESGVGSHALGRLGLPFVRPQSSRTDSTEMLAWRLPRLPALPSTRMQ